MGKGLSTVKYVAKWANISADGKYRYSLVREWRLKTHNPANWLTIDKELAWEEPKPCVFIMLNPSTADADIDDPTIRKCVGFASRWEYEKLIVLNLFAYRATKPAVLLRLHDVDNPFGDDNQAEVEKSIHRAGRIVCAWGSHGRHLEQDRTMLGWLDKAGVHRLYALGYDAKGNPRHPLMVPYETAPVIYDAL